MAAADIGDLPTALQFFDHTVQCGKPFLHEMGLVAHAEEARHSAEQAIASFVIAGSAAVTESLAHLGLVDHHGLANLERAQHIDRAVRVSEHHGLFGIHGEAPGRGVIVQITGGSMGAEPFAHKALDRSSAARQLFRRHRSRLGERAVQPEFVTDAHQGRDHGRAQIIQYPRNETFQLLLVEFSHHLVHCSLL